MFVSKERVGKMWSGHAGILVTFKKNKKEILTHATTWINHKDVTLREVSLSQRDKHCLTPLTQGHTPGERNWNAGLQGLGEGTW